jgi:hypothetical protein
MNYADVESLRITDPDYANIENQEDYDVAYSSVLTDSNINFADLEIDWKRVAEPQLDNYDIYALKKIRKALFNKENLNFEGKAELFKGTVGLFDDDSSFNPPFIRYVKKDEALKVYWDKLLRIQEIFYEYAPAYTSTVENLVDYYQPFFVLNEKEEVFSWPGLGCSCGVIKNAWDDKVILSSSINNPIGAVDGLIHESFHDRLRCLGISLVRHTGHLIENPPGVLYESPIRKDIKRPIAAVIQAQYSYIGVNDFYHNLLLNVDKIPETSKHEVVFYLRDLVGKIEGGLKTIEAHLIPKKGIGEDFFDGFSSYTRRVINEINTTLTNVE